MPNRNEDTRNRLERIRTQSGAEALKSSFSELLKSDRETAAGSLNDERLRFSTLYLLLPEITRANLFGELSPRNRTAVGLCEKMRTAASAPEEGSVPLFTRPALRWMFRTGISDDGLSEDFDRMLDVSASLLVGAFQDSEILPELVELVFRRNRKGTYTHDLIWALYSSRDPHILSRIAVYLRSSQAADRELAGRLLHYDPAENGGEGRHPHYGEFLTWYRENRPYLYFTGEGFQQTSQPIPCRVDLDAKYLCKTIRPGDGSPEEPLTDDERSRLAAFRGISAEDRSFLARYSHRLHARNPSQWARWIDRPIDWQIQTVRSGRGTIL